VQPVEVFAVALAHVEIEVVVEEVEEEGVVVAEDVERKERRNGHL